MANAKSRLSELLGSAQHEPQVITRNGKPTAVVVSIDEWEKRTRKLEGLGDFLMNSPLRGSGIDLERVRDAPRDLDF